MHADDRFARLAALKPPRTRVPVGPRASGTAEFDPLARLLAAEVGRNCYGEHLVVRRWFSTPEECAPSDHALKLLLPTSDSEQRGAHASAADPSSWLFLDTETTGLAGGTGTYAFLVGLGWWEAGGLQVEQFFMRDHAEEHSLLLELSRRLAERPVLVTFNGKSFDWPLLETRFRLTRAIEPRPPAVHLDLLHPARQLWRLRLGSVRLKELERHVLGAAELGWDREDDVDSALIPQIYFDYLRGGSPEPLTGVFHHNQMDLRGLAALAGKILGLLAEPESAAAVNSDALELFGLSRLLCRRGEAQGARLLYEQALRASLPAKVERTARRELARLSKRMLDYERATSLWEALVEDSAEEFEAYEQLAIYYEHRAHDSRCAAQLTRQALAVLRRGLRSGRIEPGRCRRFQKRFEHRLARLEKPSESAPRALPLEAAAAESARPAGESKVP